MDRDQKPGDVLGFTPLLDERKDSLSPTMSQPMEPQGRQHNYRTATGKYRWYLLRSFYGPLKFVLIFGTVAVLLAVPSMVIDVDAIEAKAAMGDMDAFLAQQQQQTVYYVFGWLLFSWLGLAFFFAVGTAVPYVFRFVARYVNPAHMRYWRVLRTMRRPFCVAFGVTFSFLCFVAVG
jgi:hypothetical protein